jgi:hypothetical protein
MKWKTPAPPPRSVAGEKRTSRRFAFFPKKLDDGFTVWLRRYNIDEVLWLKSEELYSTPVEEVQEFLDEYDNLYLERHLVWQVARKYT